MFKKANGTVGRAASARTLAAVKKSQKILEAAAAHEAIDINVAAVPSSSKQKGNGGMVKATSAKGTATGSSLLEGSFSAMVDTFRAVTEPFADTDEVISYAELNPSSTHELGMQHHKRLKEAQEAAAKAARAASANKATVITYRTFAASLVCPKKFYLMENRPDLIPKMSIGDAVHLDDSVGFNELARRWDRLQFGSKAVVISDRDFDCAVQHTEDVITRYFTTQYSSLGEQAPTLTIHRPAFSAPFGGDRTNPDAGHPMLLRSRPAVLRFRPKDNQWILLESQATVDPLSGPHAAQYLQRLHFSLLSFRYWITQPHIPIAVRKRLLNIDFDGINAENEAGHTLETSARVATPIDVKRSGLLHIRQFFPGPATLLDCDPPRLVKFIQRLSLEDLLEADYKNHLKGNGTNGGVLDLSHIRDLSPEIRKVQAEVDTLARSAGKHTNMRSTRSIKSKDAEDHKMLDAQQKLIESLLTHHTLKLVEKAKDEQNVQRWISFARDSPDGCVKSAYAQAEDEEHKRRRTLEAADEAAAAVTRRRKDKSKASKAAAADAAPSLPLEALYPAIPPYSEFLSTQCTRGSGCPFFVEGLCLPQKVENALEAMDNHLFTLPSSATSRKVVWWAEGIRTIRDILHRHKAGTLKLTAPQLRYVKTVSEGVIAINPGEIDNFFKKIQYPVFIIDFEAVQFALPPFSKELAYQSVPFQFSMDVFQEDILTERPTHYDFLHFGKGYLPNEDPRPGCIREIMAIVKAERAKKKVAMEKSGDLQRIEKEAETELQAEAGARGKNRGRSKKPPKITKNSPLESPLTPYDGCFIAHFASFEKSCLEKLGQIEEGFKEEIKQFYFLDTIDLFKKGFTHPNAHGSNSLKKILPALCPDIQYGVFGSEQSASDGDSSSSSSSDSNDANSSAGGQDEQKGDNAMGVYRLWYHQEGGGTIQDLQRSSSATIVPASTAVVRAAAMDTHGAEEHGVRTVVPREIRDNMWAMLRIQLLEYCSLDTKALYELMREIWKEREAVREGPPPDKTGWVYTKPTPRMISF